MTFGQTWAENTPAGTADANTLDTIIQGVKASISERLRFGGMYWPTTHDEAAGENSYIRLTTQGSSPTNVANKGFIFLKDVSAVAELHWLNESNEEQQLTSGADFIGGMVNEVRWWIGTLANIPAGWQLADGTNGTTDLRSKQIRCVAAATDPGELTEDATMVAAHTHGDTFAVADDAHTHSFKAYSNGTGASGVYLWRDGMSCNASTDITASGSVQSDTHNHTLTGSVSSAGSASYYGLAPIMRPTS